MKIDEQNLNTQQKPQLNTYTVSGSSLVNCLVEQRYKNVLEYLFPNYERQMTAKTIQQYNGST